MKPFQRLCATSCFSRFTCWIISALSDDGECRLGNTRAATTFGHAGSDRGNVLSSLAENLFDNVKCTCLETFHETSTF